MFSLVHQSRGKPSQGSLIRNYKIFSQHLESESAISIAIKKPYLGFRFHYVIIPIIRRAIFETIHDETRAIFIPG